MREDDIAVRNMACLEQRFPDQMAAVRAIGQTVSSLVWDGGRVVDLDLGGARLYGAPADEVARTQIDAFRARPTRVVFNEPQPDELFSEFSRRMNERLLAGIEQVGPLPSEPVGEAGALVIIGVGLGLHVERLVREFPARRVIVVEPIREFLLKSLHAADWTRIMDACAGRDLDLVVDEDAKSAAETLQAILEDMGAPFVDGSWLFVHYRTEVTAAIAEEFMKRVKLFTMPRGYFDDEELMLRCHADLIARRRFRFIEATPSPPRPEPAIIVGSGPSIDECVGDISRLQDRAVIFASGTALEILLRNGIVPDFQVERENYPDTTRAREFAMDQSDFSRSLIGKIPLIASSVTHPGLFDLFCEAFVFIRDTASSTRIFENDRPIIPGAAPYAANTAVALAWILGFRDIYLFGVDCGNRVGLGHHSRDTWYYTTEDYDGDKVLEHDWWVEGNFGDKVQTNATFEWSRAMIEQVIAISGVNAGNCSDGALIRGAEPLRSGDLAFKGAALDKAAILDDIRARFPLFEPGTFSDMGEVRELLGHWDDFTAAFDAMLARAEREADDLEAFHRAVRAFLDQARDDHGRVSTLFQGSALGLIQLAAYYDARLMEKGARAALFEAFKDEYRRVFEDCKARGRSLMAEIGAK